MKKICFVSTVSLTLKAFILDIANHLYHNGEYDITFICSDDVEFQNSLPEYIKFIPVTMKRGVSVSDSIKKPFEFAKIFKRENFDIVYYITPNASLYAAIGSFLARVKTRIYSQAGMRFVSFTGLSRLIFKTTERIACMCSTHVKSQSPKNMQLAIDEKVCSKKKISVIGIGGTTGVELSLCDSIDYESVRSNIIEKLHIPEDAFVYGYVGRVNVDKGLEELIKAFEIVAKNNDNVWLVLVGPVDETNPIPMDVYENAKKNDRIVFTDLVPSNEVYNYMTVFDVLVHPTYREGFGKVIQEAMGMWLPIVTTNIPGPSEVVENGVSGLLAEVKNVDDLAEKMSLIYDDAELRQSLASAGRKRAETYFDRPIMLNNILNDMNKIVSDMER